MTRSVAPDRKQQAFDLLRVLHPPGEIFTLSSFSPRVRTEICTDAREAVRTAMAMDKEGVPGTYHMVANLRCEPSTDRGRAARGTEAEVFDVHACWVDVDGADFSPLAERRAKLLADARAAGRKLKTKAAKQQAWEEASEEERIAAIEAAHMALCGTPFPPSCIVESGRGWHGYWLLESPAVGDTLSLAKAVNRALADRTNGDTVGDLARVLRTPGTYNRKSPEDPLLCQLWSFEPTRRYNLAELAKALDVDLSKPAASKPRKRTRQRAELPALPAVPTGWWRYLENSDRARAIWHGQGFSDRSEPAMAIANLAVRSGEARDVAEVLAILDQAPACGSWVQDKPPAAIRTAEKALAENPTGGSKRPTLGAEQREPPPGQPPITTVGKLQRPVYARDARAKVFDRNGRELALGNVVACSDRGDRPVNRGWVVALKKAGALVHFEKPGTGDKAGQIFGNEALVKPENLEFLHSAKATRQDAGEVAEPWSDPVPIQGRSLPDMDCTDVFRDIPAARDLIEATARAVQMKPCPVGHSVLMAVGMAIATKFRVVLQGKARPVVEFGLLCMKSGVGKSPAVELPTDPLQDLDDEIRASEEGIQRIAAWETKRDVIDAEIRNVQNLLRKPKDGSETGLEERLEAARIRKATLGEQPLPNRYLSDATNEVLGKLMSKHGHMNVIGTEARYLKIISGFYGGKPDFDLPKKAWDGSRVAVARKGQQSGDGVHYVIPRPSLGLLQAIQPDTLRALATKRGDDYKGEGLAARLLPCFSPPMKRETPKPEDDIPAAVIETYKVWLRGLVSLPASLGGNPYLLRPSPEADAMWREAKGWFFRRPEQETMSDWTAKASDHIGRLAGILQVMLTPCAQDLTIEAEAMDRAIRLVKTFYWPHAIEFYAVLQQEKGHDTRQGYARALLKWLADDWPRLAAEHDGRTADRINVRTLCQLAKRKVPEHTRGMHRLMRELEEHGWVRASEKSSRGKPAFYWLHPELGAFCRQLERFGDT